MFTAPDNEQHSRCIIVDCRSSLPSAVSIFWSTCYSEVRCGQINLCLMYITSCDMSVCPTMCGCVIRTNVHPWQPYYRRHRSLASTLPTEAVSVDPARDATTQSQLLSCHLAMMTRHQLTRAVLVMSCVRGGGMGGRPALTQALDNTWRSKAQCDMPTSAACWKMTDVGSRVGLTCTPPR